MSQQSTYLVTRHPGALQWLRANGLPDAEHCPHLDVATLRPGDTVIGTLPIQIVADLCARGARYLHLSVNLPASHRGQELSAEDMAQLGARLERYSARREPVA